MPSPIEQAADILAKAKSVVALTGAGISVESGIPPFRGKGGLWEKMDPMEVAHIDAFMENPKRVWDLLIKDMKTVLDKARPNAGHTGLVELEQMEADGLLIMGGDEEIGLEEVEDLLAYESAAGEPLVKQDLLALPLREAREQFERAYLQQQLILCHGKVGQLAKRVGMERTHLYRKLRSLGIDFRQSGGTAVNEPEAFESEAVVFLNGNDGE